ncbi:MAG: hypothetical protein JWR34_1901 [Mycobacterium sp.]|nr:hypothetical protein [Mycobacterium sp.]
MQQEAGFRVEQVVDRRDGQCLQEQRARHTREPGPRKPELGSGTFPGVVGQWFGKSEGGPDQLMRRGGAIGILVQDRQRGLQLTGCTQQPASHRVPVLGGFGVPLFA